MNKIFSWIIIFFLILLSFQTKGIASDNSEAFKNIESIKKKYNLNGEGVSIAILDTGIDLNNNNLKINKGKNFTDSSTDFSDYDGHGTNMASVIISEKFGIASKTNLYIGKVLRTASQGNYKDISKGIIWAINNNVDIILLSLGGDKYSDELHNSIKKALEKDIIVISAIGNDGLSNKDTVKYPAKFKGVIGVGALNRVDERWFKSSQGSHIDIMAIGEGIYGYGLNSSLTKMDGTSVSAAYVAGVVALMKQYNKELNVNEINEALIKTAENKGDSYKYGYGVLQEEKALTFNDKGKMIFHSFVYILLLVLLMFLIANLIGYYRHTRKKP